jgi:hypothetical protein
MYCSTARIVFWSIISMAAGRMPRPRISVTPRQASLTEL